MAPPPAPPRVVCLGNVVADHVFRVEDIPQPPAKIAARSYVLNAGGMAANAAIAVTRLGGCADFWGRVGDDLNAPLLAAALEADGVNTAGLRRMAGGRSPVSAVLVDRHGERTIIGFRGADLGTDPAWLPLQTLAGAGALCCDPRWPEGVAAAAAEARRLGVPVVLDGEKSETRILVDVVPRVDHAIFSVTGLQNFAPGCAPEEGLRRALASGPVKLAAVTRGEKGTLWLAPGMVAPQEIPAFPVEATNTTGAGDVFHGAYALAIAEGMGVEAALRFASAAGALRARDGTTPYRPMVEAMLAGL
jgi:sulfofructose kinase